MNHNPILVRKIKHLTDARYFAAMGVDWMSIHLTSDPNSFSLWHMLKDWIEGVKLAAEINSDDEMVLAKTIIDAVPDGLIINQVSNLDIPDSMQLFFEVSSTDQIMLPSAGSFILSYDPALLTSEVILQLPSEIFFLQARWTPPILEQLLNEGYTGGICFKGGDEDKTGVRDYGMMDDLLGLLVR